MASDGPYELVAALGSPPPSINRSINIRAYGVFVQNLTAQFVYIPGAGFVPPNTSGGFPLGGTNNCIASFLAPPNVAQPAAVPGQTCYLTYVDYPIPPTAGPTQGATAIQAVTLLERFARAALPAPGNQGRLVEVTDNVEGLFLDNGTKFFSLQGEVMNALDQGAVGDGVTDDTAALQAALNKTGLLYLPGKPGGQTYVVSSADLTVPDNTYLVCAPNADLKMSGRSLVIGSAAVANRFHNAAIIRIQGTTAIGRALVEIYNMNVDHSLGARQFIIVLSNNSAAELLHCHSTNGFGYADVKHVLSTFFQPSVGIRLICGDDSGTASIGGDFINGNTFEGTLSCTHDCILAQGIGPVVGSVVGSIARNKFDRMDCSSYGLPAGAGRGLNALDSGLNRSEFIHCTFETGGGGAAFDIDTHLATGGNYFRHPVTSQPKASQSLSPNGRDVWIDDELDTPEDFGIYTLGLIDGTAAAPTYSWKNSPTMGFYRGSAGVIGVSGKIAPGGSNSLAQSYGWSTANSGPGAGGTVFTGPFTRSAAVATENTTQGLMPKAGTVRRLFVVTSTAQPGGGTMVVTMRKNGVDQAVTLTINAGAAAGTFSDTTNSFAVVAGDLISIKLVNNDGGAVSALVISIGFAVEIDTAY